MNYGLTRLATPPLSGMRPSWETHRAPTYLSGIEKQPTVGCRTDGKSPCVGARIVEELRRARVEKIEIDPNVTDADFRLEEKPGMLVKTSVRPPYQKDVEVQPAPIDTHYYRIDERGHRREVTFQQGVEKPVSSARFGCGIWQQP